MLELLSQQLAVTLRKGRLRNAAGSYMEIDGMSQDPSILCEAWAHQGPAKSAQRAKVLVDAFKLVYASALLNGPVRKILLFSDESATSRFRGDTWAAQALSHYGIEIMVVELPEEIRDSVLRAQRRQTMVSPFAGKAPDI
jgi:hypothetical protein